MESSSRPLLVQGYKELRGSPTLNTVENCIFLDVEIKGSGQTETLTEGWQKNQRTGKLSDLKAKHDRKQY